jgi:hypothetical protein
MRVAAYQEKPNPTELVDLGGEDADPRSRDLHEATRSHAFLIGNYELEQFESLVKENFGDIVFNRRLRWAS